ncbi:MAG: glycosyltransferase family 1 protein [bacterium]|nr:glycosyltransferase family 1 protein [bacterium]
MKIAIDARALTKQPTGTGYYLKNLLDEFARAEVDNTYYLCSSREFSYIPPENESRFIPVIQRGLPGNLWLQLQVPRLIKKYQFDLFHSPFGVIPFRCDCATVSTVHDLAFHFYPKLTDFKNRILLPRLVPKSLNLATTIIVDSESTKQDLIVLYKIADHKIAVIHLAAGSQYHPIPKIPARNKLAEKYRINTPFILFVGTLEPRKNIPLLLRAYEQLSPELRSQYKLVFVGKKGWQEHSIFRLVEELKLQEQTLFTDYVPEEDLPFFYNSASVFVYPSLYEGFGLPVIDAMACGIPVITSDTSSMPEIVSYAGIFVAPGDVSALTNAITRLLIDRELSEHLSEKAITRAHLFSWRNTATKTLEIYTAAVNKFTVSQYQK